MIRATPQDDFFHASGDEDWWFESWWFSFFVPERDLMVYVYPWFRPGLGVAGGGVIAWDAGACEPWNIVHSDYAWHLPCADPAALIEGATLTLPQRMAISIVEPGRSYGIRYDHPLLSIDVRFSATRDANIFSKPLGGSKLFGGRIDQCGHVGGSIVLRGEKIAIDCYSMRDRSWGIRTDDNRGMHLGYFHATFSGDDAFLAVSDENRRADDGSPVVNGYLLRDGHQEVLATGRAMIERDGAGRPVACAIEAVDAAGRRLEARGRSRNWFAYFPFPGMFNWSSLADWDCGTHVGIGELQDTWYPDDWRLYSERLRASSLA